MNQQLQKLLLCFAFSVFCTALSAFAQSPRYPFPQHRAYVRGSILPSHVSRNAMDDSVRSFYEQWEARYLVSGCGANQYYVFFNYEGGAQPPNAICVSEGQGYGMLITAIMAGYDANAKTYFDGLYNYYRAHPSSVNNRLMAWRQRTGCVSETDDSSSATDGDLDIAYALLLADKQWGSTGIINYYQEAMLILDAIMQDEVNRTLYSVKLGDWSNSSEPAYFNSTRTSDFMLNHFKAFAEATGDTRWYNVVDNCYGYLATIQTNNSAVTGLFPDFIKNLNTTPVPAQANFLEGPNDGKYYYNACRDPWRIGIDYLLSGDVRAYTALQKINSWLKAASGNNPANIHPGYQLNGTPLHTDYTSMAFTAPFAVGAMVDSSNQTWLNSMWNEIVGTSVSAEGYYENSLKLLSMLAMTGNWWNPVGERTLSFSGYTWSVKNSGEEAWGPGPNYFSDALSNVWVDSLERLHLKITNRNGQWQCSEVVLNQSLGYGRYMFHVQGTVGTLNKNVVLGLFTWDDAPEQNHREIDIEFARWGDAGDPTNAQFVVQPFDTPGNLTRWVIPETMATSTNSFNWQADSIGFLGVGSEQDFPPYNIVNSTWQYTGADIPAPGNEHARINLWLFQGNAPSDSQEIEIIISKFEFNPRPPAPSQPVLVSPEQGAQVGEAPITFRWNRVSGAETYHLQVSRSSSFSPLLLNDSTITDTSYSFGSLTGSAQYYWRVRAKNSGGLSEWSETRNFTLSSQSKWKLISVPFSVSDPRKTILFPTALSEAFSFSSAGYTMQDSMYPGMGYWLKFGTDTTINVAGDSILADTINVTAGWNLIGSISLPVNIETITTEPLDIIESKWYGYEHGYIQAVEVIPGKAYWVKVKESGAIILR